MITEIDGVSSPFCDRLVPESGNNPKDNNEAEEHVDQRSQGEPEQHFKKHTTDLNSESDNSNRWLLAFQETPRFQKYQRRTITEPKSNVKKMSAVTPGTRYLSWPRTRTEPKPDR